MIARKQSICNEGVIRFAFVEEGVLRHKSKVDCAGSFGRHGWIIEIVADNISVM